jgi:hypothetical protein
MRGIYFLTLKIMSKKLFALFFCMLLLTGCMENKVTPEEEDDVTPPTAEDVTVPAVTGDEAVAPETTTTDTTVPSVPSVPAPTDVVPPTDGTPVPPTGAEVTPPVVPETPPTTETPPVQ